MSLRFKKETGRHYKLLNLTSVKTNVIKLLQHCHSMWTNAQRAEYKCEHGNYNESHV